MLYGKIIDLQKLNEALRRVMRNKPAAGVDNITCEAFEAGAKYELKQLNLELTEHRYDVLPVKLVMMKQENKYREISLYCMRDKVVQTSIVSELTRMYEGTLSDRAYAYRNNKSAMQASNEIEAAVLSGKYRYVCKTDISKFFDNIRHDILEKILRLRIREDDVIDLIMAQLKTPSVDNTGVLKPKEIGVYQGSSISPILSNIYMTDIDFQMEKIPVFYARYADDMVIMADSKEKLEGAYVNLRGMLEKIGLQINEEKTVVREISEGFEFLGYAFAGTGKSTPKKAEEKLQTRLEDVWFTMKGCSLEERLKKGSQILNGWEQYYRDEREIKDIYEFVVLVYMMRYKNEIITFSEKRCGFVNCHKDIAKYLISVWKELGLKKLVLLEYEQFFEISNISGEIDNAAYLKEIINLYDKIIECENKDDLTSLMQAYSDLKLYDRAERITDRIKELETTNTAEIVFDHHEQAELFYNTRTFELFDELLVGREDMHVREVLLEGGRRKSEFVAEPLTRDVLKRHFVGSETVGTYIVRNNDTVHFLVFDIDVSRRLLLAKPSETELDGYLKVAAETALRLKEEMKKMGLKGYIEFSGYRGYHVWLFCTEWIPVRYALSIIDILEDKMKSLPDAVTLESFPTKGKRKNGSGGQTIKLPYGMHLYSGKRSYFCDESFRPVDNLNDFLATIAKYSVENLKRVIGANISEETISNPNEQKKIIEMDFSELGQLSGSVLEVLKGCTLMQYLVNKAMRTGYLNHFERLSVLNVFGHVGEDGKEFVHKVMSYTLNYKYHVTQRFVQKIPEKPISCIKLRDQYKQVTAEYGCSCMFKRTKDCYPSPVIHALRKNDEENHDITIPTSRTISEAKKETVYEELNLHVKVQELAAKVAELKKQKRGIDKALRKVEQELNIVFDNAGVDCMEVDLGMLIRKKNGDGYDWVIEI